MPYVSDKQRKFFHTDTAKAKGISKATVDEFDQASKGLKLPRTKKSSAKSVMQAVSKKIQPKQD